MAWPIALGAEFLGALYKAFPEETLPIAVHGHPRGEWVAAIHEPAREAEAVARCIIGHRAERGGCAGENFLSPLVVLAAFEHKRFARSSHILHYHCTGAFGFLGVKFGAEGLDLLV